ncbi:hypothetical protein HOD20_03500 [archaeon]|jgi:hypothetical protein|nr:hypothetical protein [archaeon]MBT4351567.1 hypothetical protein [archaeon]MBT4648615.1 hypothetical protein [archaeon]MBT6821445.1 hypothetical protein [archaeon]MBT7393039.1 hypothetical protein [archaeon]
MEKVSELVPSKGNKLVENLIKYGISSIFSLFSATAFYFSFKSLIIAFIVFIVAFLFVYFLFNMLINRGMLWNDKIEKKEIEYNIFFEFNIGSFEALKKSGKKFLIFFIFLTFFATIFLIYLSIILKDTTDTINNIIMLCLIIIYYLFKDKIRINFKITDRGIIIEEKIRPKTILSWESIEYYELIEDQVLFYIKNSNQKKYFPLGEYKEQILYILNQKVPQKK